jgi:hypothetical protein
MPEEMEVKLLDYITTKQAAERWDISVRRVQALCENGQIPQAERLGNMWVMPDSTPKPSDGRKNNGRKPLVSMQTQGGSQ